MEGILNMEYKIVRSGRKTLSLEITRELELLVRAPRRLPRAAIDKFVLDNEKWIAAHTERARIRLQNHPEPTDEQKKEYIKAAKEYIPKRIEYYAPLLGVSPTGITITGAKTRFGSCSPKNRLSFSWRLMSYPCEIVDYVVVHELAHIKHHNHGADFYKLIESVMPDHKERRKKLKE